MKNFLLSLFVILSGSFAASAGSNDTLHIQTKIYCDHCMECESCWPLIEKEILYTKGVKFAWFDDKKMVISVVYNSKKTTPEAIRQAVSNAGFDADDVKADAAGYEKLDGCCKKK